ncbi:exodeoxyribonuclease III [Nocardioides jiangxiensis]|uniref:Exodeoxyribonuclease III n=1 Tax=Nocardioides jiangxiensis TaxID=3064524 RepID=A0ABT9B217_9ACTN|nr:exodeoxyribonuclease III [Nocardioides sp. WY-20]MDO7868894.1 exodeoxyribonuclease III [Nocardioides sp. WY-20]
MRIATWNVNSLRTRIDRVEAFLQRHDIDVLAIQETKAKEEQIPLMGLQMLGYDVAAVGYDQWNGVAIVSRVGLEDVTVGFEGMPTFKDASEARALGATCGGVRVWSLYVPNGRKPDDPHYAYKLEWLAALRAAAGEWSSVPTALVGDWNICPTDEDVFDVSQFRNSTHVTPAERDAFAAFGEDGWLEVTRSHAAGYTYWDYYRQRFERDRGLKIDFAICSPPLASRVTGAFIDREERDPTVFAGAPSDHAPVIVDIAD